MSRRDVKRRKLDEKRWFTCNRTNGGRYEYQVFENNRKLFSTACKATKIAEVEAHAREELRLHLRRKGAPESVTTEEFDAALEALLDDMSGAEILATEGAYEVFSEALNNETIDLALTLRGDDKETT